MNNQDHWEQVYRTKRPAETSWHTPHLNRSLAFIRAAAPDHSASIIDVGGGESTLVEDLLAEGYRDLTVLDLSAHAIEVSRHRMGSVAERVCWLTGDVTTIRLETGRYDVWHDRAAFHFLVEPSQRAAYVRQLSSALRPGGHGLIATFGPQGPERCSGLSTRRYDAESLQAELGSSFRLLESAIEQHQTPFGTAQQFLYCHFALE